MKKNLGIILLLTVLAVSACSDVTPPVALESEEGVLSGAVGGSVFTVDNPEMGEPCLNGPTEGEVVNCNHFKRRLDVWMSSGSFRGKNGLSDGTYLLSVLEPGGQSNPNDGGEKNLSDQVRDDRGFGSGRGNPSTVRQFTVVDGRIAASLEFDKTYDHPTRGKLLHVWPFDVTRNKAGEYVLAVCRISASIPEAPIDPTPTVSPRDCKFDAFRVEPEPPPPPTTSPLWLPQTISAGGAHACGLGLSGEAYCWGSNSAGQVGDGTTTERIVPTPVAGGMTFDLIATGGSHTCGLRSTGEVYCWGSNISGQLGNGSTVNQSTPILVSGGLTFAQLAVGTSLTCGLTKLGTAFCWGNNYHGHLGDGTTTNRSVPTKVAFPLAFKQIAAGFTHTCGITEAGAAYCWGEQGDGGLGTNDGVNHLVPTAVAGGLTFKQITAATWTTCALTQAGAAYCWGDGSYGQIGSGASVDRPTPWPVSGSFTFSRIIAGGQKVCAWTNDYEALCWGRGDFGELGNGSLSHQYTPAAVSGGHAFVQVSPGYTHTCGVTTAGVAYCWGRGDSGELGIGTKTLQQPNPLQVSSAVQGGLLFDEIDGGNGFTCGLSSAKYPYCWGLNATGQLGNGSTTNRLVPGPVFAPTDNQRLSSGHGHSCVVSSTGVANCWGSNLYGQVGDGTTTNRLEPAAVSGGISFVMVSANGQHTCGVSTTGSAYCWGGKRERTVGRRGRRRIARYPRPWPAPWRSGRSAPAIPTPAPWRVMGHRIAGGGTEAGRAACRPPFLARLLWRRSRRESGIRARLPAMLSRTAGESTRTARSATARRTRPSPPRPLPASTLRKSMPGTRSPAARTSTGLRSAGDGTGTGNWETEPRPTGIRRRPSPADSVSSGSPEAARTHAPLATARRTAGVRTFSEHLATTQRQTASFPPWSPRCCSGGTEAEGRCGRRRPYLLALLACSVMIFHPPFVFSQRFVSA
jgi:alpha-tubulin suppressor-like RCC1 family protein